MKILGISQCQGKEMLYLKPDSALLVNRKPFFVPEKLPRLVAYPCVVVRFNKLGKSIEERFASRYYSEIALGLNIRVDDGEMLSHNYGLNMLSCLAFDYSAVVGDFVDVADMMEYSSNGSIAFFQGNDSRKVFNIGQLCCGVDFAISQVSKYLTVRMGDMLCVDFAAEPFLLQSESIICGDAGNKQCLYCKIK